MKDRVQQLIDILFDESSRVDEVDDAIMDLGNFNDQRALMALIAFAKNPGTNAFSLDVCGESIAKIWAKTGLYDRDLFLSFPSETRHEIIGYMRVKDPSILNFLLT
jgi:hypothetical protein